MKKEKEELKGLLNEYVSISLADRSNHWIRRFYRCFIDGSYEHINSGHEGYKRNISELEKLSKNSKKSYNHLRGLSISAFTDFLTVEFTTLSRATIHNTVTDFFSYSVETFNQQLMDDFCNLVEKNLTDFFSPELLANKRGL